MEIIKVKSISMLLAIFVTFSGVSIAQSSDYTTGAQDKAWMNDMEGKVDATIKVLSLIKEELEEEKKQLSTPKDTSEDAWIESLRKTIQSLKRVWDEVKEIRKEELNKTETLSFDETDQQEWTDQMSDKLEKSIKAMQIIKDELDEMEKEKN